MARDDVAYRERVRAKYNDATSIWSDDDRWHLWCHRQIASVLAGVRRTNQPRGDDNFLLIDVGSAGETYGLSAELRLDVDIAENRLPRNGWRVCANAEYLPIVSAVSDLVVCVGPVVNYCSLEEVVSELSRISKPGGRIVLHVELSNSWEFAGTSDFRADAAFVETFYKGREWIWVYSDALVRRVARSRELRLERVRYFHILSSLAYRLFRHPNVAASVAGLDRLLRWLPGIGAIADSAIYVFRRQG